MAPTFRFLLLCLFAAAALVSARENSVSEEKSAAKDTKETVAETSATSEDEKATTATAAIPEEPDEDDDAAAEKKEAAEEAAAVARPVASDPVQVYGWREWVTIADGSVEQRLQAKLDTGALTSSIHAEEKELFERDGKKWVRFVVTDTGEKDSPRMRMEAPLVKIARIKNPGGESEAREVVRLPFNIGDRKLRADFTLNNRSNMLSPILIGRRTIKELGWVDPARAYLADKKLMR